jgi:hypothetical protein
MTILQDVPNKKRDKERKKARPDSDLMPCATSSCKNIMRLLENDCSCFGCYKLYCNTCAATSGHDCYDTQSEGWYCEDCIGEHAKENPSCSILKNAPAIASVLCQATKLEDDSYGEDLPCATPGCKVGVCKHVHGDRCWGCEEWYCQSCCSEGHSCDGCVGDDAWYCKECWFDACGFCSDKEKEKERKRREKKRIRDDPERHGEKSLKTYFPSNKKAKK